MVGGGNTHRVVKGADGERGQYPAVVRALGGNLAIGVSTALLGVT
jgi:hypothetical protein